MKKLAVAFALSVAVLTQPVSAAIIVATYTGRVSYGGDHGLFGVNGDLAGHGVVVRFQFDDQVPAGIEEHSATEGYLAWYGNSSAFASVTINGYTTTINGIHSALIVQRNGDPLIGDGVQHGVRPGAQGSVVWADVRSSVNDFIEDTNFRAPLDYQLQPGDTSLGGFELNEFGRGLARGTFAFSRVTISAVPEPTTWAMMIVGFGMVGGAMRRRIHHGKVIPCAG